MGEDPDKVGCTIDQELHRFVMNHLYSAKQNLFRFPASSLAVAINATILVYSMMDETATVVSNHPKKQSGTSHSVLC